MNGINCHSYYLGSMDSLSRDDAAVLEGGLLAEVFQLSWPALSCMSSEKSSASVPVHPWHWTARDEIQILKNKIKMSPGGWTVILRPQVNGRKSRWGGGPRPFPFPHTVQASLGTHGYVIESVAHWVALVFLLLLFLSFFFSPSMWALRRLEYACEKRFRFHSYSSSAMK